MFTGAILVLDLSIDYVVTWWWQADLGEGKPGVPNRNEAGTDSPPS